MTPTIEDLAYHVPQAARALRILERIEQGDRALDWIPISHLVAMSHALPLLMDRASMEEHRHDDIRPRPLCGWCGNPYEVDRRIDAERGGGE